MPQRFSISSPPEEETASALPMGDGQPTSIPDAPEPPERPDFPRIDVEQQAPQPNQEARNRQALTGLLGALGTAFASAGDDPTMLNISSGLTQGSGEQLRQRREAFKQRQEAFNEFLTEAQRFNREMEQKETQAEYERKLADFERQSTARQNALDRRSDRIQSRVDDQREHEQTLEEIRTRGEQRRRTQRVENQAGGGGSTEPIQMDDLSVPSDPIEAERRLNMVNARLEEMQKNRDRFTYEERNERGEMVTRTDEEYRERLSKMEQYRRLLRDQVQSGSRDESNRDSGRQDAGGAASGRVTSQPSIFNQGVPRPQSETSGGRPQGSGQQTGGQGSGGQGGSYVDELNQSLRSQGRRAALNKIADDLEAGRITERQAAAYYQQVAPDSLLNR